MLWTKGEVRRLTCYQQVRSDSNTGETSQNNLLKSNLGLPWETVGKAKVKPER